MRWRRAIKNLERANYFLNFTLYASECCMSVWQSLCTRY